MQALTPAQVLDVQRRWTRNRFVADIWLLGLAIAAIVYLTPTSREWIRELIAPVSPVVLLVVALAAAWYPLTNYTRCPACRKHLPMGRQAHFCPNCGVRLRERAEG
jgi:hypothetical protein